MLSRYTRLAYSLIIPVMAEFIEGKHPVWEALSTHVPITRIFLADGNKHDRLLQDILHMAARQHIVMETVPRAQLDKRSKRGSHQGIMAQAQPFAYASLDDIIARGNDQAVSLAVSHSSSAAPCALIIVLDHITDAGNLGAIARSAESVGAAGIIIPNKRSAYVTASTYKSSAGAISHIPVAQVANLQQALARLKNEGYWVAGASEKAEGGIWDANLTGNVCLVMGNENTGLARLTQEACDFFVSLPQRGVVSSLNVAQSATVCMYEWLRQNRLSLQECASGTSNTSHTLANANANANASNRSSAPSCCSRASSQAKAQ